MAPVPKLADRAAECAQRLRSADEVLLASHIDADGLTSAGIATTALERAGIPTTTVFKNQLDDEEIASIAARDFQTVLFTDFGSGQLDAITKHEQQGDFEPIVVDHHQPADAETRYHLNPLLEGIDGASELSGAGASYLLARALEEDEQDNRDLAALAVVGAVGDMQAVGGELVGANRAIVEDGMGAGVLEEATDIALYGKQTRPLPKLLEYADQPQIPGVSGDEAGAIDFLESLGIDLEVDDEWRRWVDLSAEERQTVVSGLVQRGVERGVPADRIDSLVGTSYTLSGEAQGTELRDASEFSTLLNATARYERADVGLAVCLGDREQALERARRLLANHRRNLSEGLEYVRENGVESGETVQWFDADDAIRETIVGIVAGMALGLPGVDRERPIVAFARKSEDERKVSARGTATLVRQGLDLSDAIHTASVAVGGGGGGHDIAAGATIPAARREEFIDRLESAIAEQLA
ncbi:phosphoesterase RecJ domain protein [Halorhabdus utahensis DSM 12940]|uniref:Phosphoesterase RecJ domain protein n=1 Tax=Halorhabdus utahensis (strain DSM 12940 / JCM 11049 / AX-2) TaxID=519442 RepID=C7NUV1_HALUD|nr:DHH family phosphoesterase [Halorhabdus utahensis]ACV11114.1 phosphoesterase RecJ domain protein [Halorhabdus utahensis DSM 12940]